MGQSRLLHWPRTNARQIGLRASSCSNGHERKCLFDDDDVVDSEDEVAVYAAHSPRRNQCGHGGLTRRSRVSAPERELGMDTVERAADAGRATAFKTDEGDVDVVDLGVIDGGRRRHVSARAVRECDANRNGTVAEVDVDDTDDDDDNDEDAEAAG